MRRLAFTVLLTSGLCSCALLRHEDAAAKDPAKIPVRGLHLFAPTKKELAPTLAFINGTLAKQGVNALILEFNYSFDFRSRPEFAAAWALDKDGVRQIARACRKNGIELIPQINCLGHQSWAKENAQLLARHPEFDESQGKTAGNQGIYCRSYCPLHPEVHAVLFDLIDELAKACRAKSFHVGMDEVFILADPDCPRCKGKDRAELFAGEVTVLRDHLRSIGCRMWMWGDRFIDGKATGLGEWEGSRNGTQRAVDLVPKDVVICDWHYDGAPETPQYFAGKGFDVVACPWRKPSVALGQLAHIRAMRAAGDPVLMDHARGLVQTTWVGARGFMSACGAVTNGAPPSKTASRESAECFFKLFAAMRGPAIGAAE